MKNVKTLIIGHRKGTTNYNSKQMFSEVECIVQLYTILQLYNYQWTAKLRASAPCRVGVE